MALSRLTPLLAALFPVLALANASAPLAEAERLLQQGQTQAALAIVETHLAKQADDPEARFLKGMILAKDAQTDAAIEVFKALTEDHPELPEPHNNLAVLYAAQGRYEMARRSLELAILTHPGYATAYENLGDLYARMAVQAYDQSLQLDAGKTAIQGKSNAIRTALGLSGGQAGVAAARTIPLQTPPSAAMPAPEQASVREPPRAETRAQSPAAPRGASPSTPPSATPPAPIPAPPHETPLPAPVMVRPVPETPPALPAAAPEDAAATLHAIRQALQAWASQQAQTRAYDWHELTDIEIRPEGDQAAASAVQRYQRGEVKGWQVRQFHLRRLNGQWQIERVR